MNPSELLVRSLEGRVIGGRVVAVRIFPVETRTLRDRIETALREERAEFAIGLGYAPGRTALALERVGLNVLDFEIPDAVGATRKNEPVQPGGPDARLQTLPVSEILAAWTSLGVPGYLSDSAGTYLCNQWLYEALALAASSAPPVPVGFVHVPALPAQAVQLGADRTPSMALDLMRRGLETAIEATASWLDATPVAPPTPAEPAEPAHAGGNVWIPQRTTRR